MVTEASSQELIDIYNIIYKSNLPFLNGTGALLMGKMNNSENMMSWKGLIWNFNRCEPAIYMMV